MPSPFVSRGVLLVGALLLVGSLQAQDFDLLHLDYFLSSTMVEDRAVPAPDIAVSRFSAGLAYPVVVNRGKTRLVNGLRYQRIGLSFDGTGSLSPSDAAHYVRYELIVFHQLSQQWRAIVFLSPGITSDFDAGLSADDVHIQTALLAERRVRPNLVYGFGVAVRNRLSLPVLPLLRLQTTLGRRTHLQISAPSLLHVWQSVRPGGGFELHLKARYQSVPFNLHDAADNSVLLKHTTGIVLLTGEVPLTGGLRVAVGPGMALRNRLELDTDATSERLSLSSGPFVRAGLVLRQ